MRELAPQFAAAGVRLAAVVQAEPEVLEEKCGSTDELLCIPDPEHVSARAMGLGKMPLWKLSSLPAILRARRRAMSAGHRQDWRRTLQKESDTLLVPGAMMVSGKSSGSSGGRILWLYRGEHVADLPDASDLLAIAQEYADPSHSARERS